ncbi:MAG TPA: PBP1A family penicillin-binding protein, partial [Patescibacteria group bacterium]
LGLSGAVMVYGRDLPSDQTLTQWKPAEATRIYDRNGTLLYELYGNEKRVVVSGDDISPYLRFATVAIEDQRFYDHYGIDPRGILRAAVRNAQHDNRTEGGSTITQQLAKNVYLSPRRTFDRKIREAMLAIKLEQHYTKDQILTLYLNQVGYGSNAYGAEAASQMYFGKPAKDLTLAEAATLAALPKSPGTLSPYSSTTDRLIARRNTVIKKMVEMHYLPPQEAVLATQQKLAVKPREEKITAPHFVMYVKEKLIEKYGEEMVLNGGLQVTTTLDLSKQQLAEKIANESTAHLSRAGATNMGLVAVEPKTGEILAMLGSKDYFDVAHDGNVNVTISSRPPGSSFKPVVYAGLMEKNGWGPGSTLFDVETDFGDASFPYVPNNYDEKYHGPVSIREALANSYNVPAVKAMSLIGKEDTISLAQRLGITTLTDPNRYGLSLVLGGGDIRLLELAGAYTSFANEGAYSQPVAIRKVVQGDHVLFEHYSEPKPVFRPEVAYEVSSILSDPVARSRVFGTRTPLNIAGHTVAVKTGTTQEYRDAWTVGYTPSLVVGVWVGNNDYHPMKSGSAGAMAAAPLWNTFVSQALAGTPNEDFVAPSGIQIATIDAITGKLPTDITRETRQDLFASWQLPGQVELASFQIYDCNGQVKATKRSYVVTSERPNDPNWEKPVLEWARTHGYPVRHQGDIHEPCPTPSVEVVEVQNPEEAALGGIPAELSPTFVIESTPKPTPEVQVTPTPRPSAEEPTPSPSPTVEPTDNQSRTPSTRTSRRRD